MKDWSEERPKSFLMELIAKRGAKRCDRHAEQYIGHPFIMQWITLKMCTRPKGVVKGNSPKCGNVQSLWQSFVTIVWCCDVTNQLWGKCRRHDHSRGSRGMSRKILQNYTYKYAFSYILETNFSIMLSRGLLGGETENWTFVVWG